MLRWNQRWASWLKRRPKKRLARRLVRHDVASALQRLEERTLLAAVAWTGLAADSNWFQALNWDSGTVPGAEDDVFIPVSASSEIIAQGQDINVRSLNSQVGLRLVSATLTVAEASQVDGKLDLSGGGIAGSGTLVVSQFVISGSETTNLSGAGGTLRVTSSFDFQTTNAGQQVVLTDRTLVLASSVNSVWSNGQLVLNGAASVENLGALTIDGEVHFFAGDGQVHRVTNSGTVQVSGEWHVSSNARLTNTGTVQVDADAMADIVDDGTSTGKFLVAAAGELSLSKSTLTESSEIRGEGLITLNEVVSTGLIDLNSDATDLRIKGINRLTGSQVQIGGTITFDGFGHLNVGTHSLNLKQLNFRLKHELTPRGLFDGDLTAGEIVTEELNVTLEGGSVGTLASGRLCIARVNGPGKLEVTRALNCVAGTITDAFAVTDRELVLASTATSRWSKGLLAMDRAGSVRNDGLFIANALRIYGNGGGFQHRLTNNGTMQIQEGRSHVTNSARLTNNGTIHVLSGGRFESPGGETSSGTFIADANGELPLSDMTLTSSSSLSGSGRFELSNIVSSGIVNLDADSAAVGFTGVNRLTGNVVSLGADLTLSGFGHLDLGARSLTLKRLSLTPTIHDSPAGLESVLLIAGDIRTDELVVDLNSSARIAGSGAIEVTQSAGVLGHDDPHYSLILQDRQLVLGQTTQSSLSYSTLQLDGSSSVLNQGNWLLDNSATITGNGDPLHVVTNSGTIRTSGPARVIGTARLVNNGRVDVSSGSRLQVANGGTSSGIYEVVAGATLALSQTNLTSSSSLSGSGRFELSNVVSSGTVNFDANSAAVKFSGVNRLTGNVVSMGADLTLSDFGHLDLGTRSLTLKRLSLASSIYGVPDGLESVLLIAGGIRTDELIVDLNSSARIAGSGAIEVTQLAGVLGHDDPQYSLILQDRQLMLRPTTQSSLSYATLQLDGTSSVLNQGNWLLENSATITGNGNPLHVVTNSGTIRTSGPARVIGTARLVNNGRVAVSSGSIFQVADGGTSSGNYEVVAGATLALSQTTLTSSSSLSGSGRFELSNVVSSGTVNLDANSAAVGFTGVNRLTGNVVSLGADLTLSDFGHLDLGTRALTLKRLSLSSSIYGVPDGLESVLLIAGDIRTDVLQVNLFGSMRIGGSGKIDVTQSTPIFGVHDSHYALILQDRQLVLGPTTESTLSYATLQLDGTSSVLNQGNWLLDNSATITGNGDPMHVMTNSGTIRTSGSARVIGTTRLVNNGRVSVSSGSRLQVADGGTSSGNYEVVVGATLALSQTTLTSSSSLSGSGRFELSNVVSLGTVNLDADSAAIFHDEVSLASSGTLTVRGTIDVRGLFLIVGGVELIGSITGVGEIELSESARVNFGTLEALPTTAKIRVGSVDLGNARLMVSLPTGFDSESLSAFSLINVVNGIEGIPRIVNEAESFAAQESVLFKLSNHDLLVTFEGGDGNDMVLVPLKAEEDLGTLLFVDGSDSPPTTLAGHIENVSNKDLVRFRTPNVPLNLGQQLEIAVALTHPDDSELDPHVRVFQVMADGQWLRVAFDDDSGDGTDALAKFYAGANEDYVVVAGGFASTTGAYQLDVRVTGTVVDDFPNLFNSARSFGQLGSLVAPTTIANHKVEIANDVDFIEVTAGHTGLIDITQSSVGNRNVLFVFDSRQRLLGFNEGANSTTVRVNKRENDRLIIRSSFGEGAIGSYDLRFSNPNPNDDRPNSFREARNASLGTAALEFDADDQAVVMGNIEVFADLDLVSFVSAVTGRFTARLQADTSLNSLLDPVVTVFDALRNVLVANDDIQPKDLVDREGKILVPANRNSFVTFDVRQGARYYVQASGFGIDEFDRPAGQAAATGRYVLELKAEDPDDVPNVVTEATPLVLDESGAAATTKVLNSDADVDVFEVTAAKSGTLTVTLNPQASPFTASLNILNDRLIQIGQAESLKQTASLTLVVENVTAGQTLFVRVGGSATTSAGPKREINVGYQLAIANQEVQTTGTPLVDSRVGLELERELVNGLARALEQFATEDDVATKRPVLDMNPLPNVTVESNITIHKGGEVARATNESIVASFLFTQGGQANLDEPVFLIWIDPIMPQVSATTSTDTFRVGHTIDNGTVNEAQSRNYYSGDGVTQLLILSATGVQRFEVQLFGLGGSFRVGINHITRESLSTITIQDSLYKAEFKLVYDFTNSNPTPSTKPPSPTPVVNVPPPIIPTTFAGALATSSADQSADAAVQFAMNAASSTAATDAAAKANADDSENGGSSPNKSEAPAPASKSDKDSENEPANKTAAAQAEAQAALNALREFLNANDLSQIPGGAVIQQAVNFFGQFFSPATPPSESNTTPPNNPAKPGTSTNSPNGTKPNSDNKPTTGSKATAKNQAVSQTPTRWPRTQNASRSHQVGILTQAQTKNAPHHNELRVTHLPQKVPHQIL